MNREIADALGPLGGPISRRDHPDLVRQVDYALKLGTLRRLLPGVYAHADAVANWLVRAQAVNLWDPNAVVMGTGAAALTFWHDRFRGSESTWPISVANARMYGAYPGFTCLRRTIPCDMVVTRSRVRITRPTLTALDLAIETSGNSIDDALRARQVTIGGMQEALRATSGHHGNADKHVLLLDSRSEPWSSGERLVHRELRAAGIRNWKANVPIMCDGQLFFQDIAFEDCPLVLEIDGRVHMQPQVFELDRRRGNLLLLAGKYVLHFTMPMVRDGLLVPTVRQTRAMLGV